MAMLPMLSDFPPRRIEVSILVYPGFELLDAACRSPIDRRSPRRIPLGRV
jgi:hypothetical protein